MVFRVVLDVEGNDALAGQLLQAQPRQLGQWMRRMQRHTHRMPLDLLKMQIANLHAAHAHQQGDMQAAVAQATQHFLGRQIMQLHPHPGAFTLELSQHARQQLHRQRRRIADADLPAFTVGNRLGAAHRLLQACQHRPRLAQQLPARLGQTQRPGAVLKQCQPKVRLQVADLPAQRRLGHAKACRRTGDILLLGDSNEVAQVSEFH